MSPVTATVNGQSCSIDALSVEFSVDSDWIHAAVGALSADCHGRLIFVLKNERLSDGTYVFQLASHCFTSLTLTYDAEELAGRLDALCVAIERLRPTMPAPPATLPLASYHHTETLTILADDYGRMGVERTPSSAYRLSHVNGDFRVCPTYPPLFATHRSISDTTLRHAAKYRARGRLPILSYLHSTGAALFRSAQALAGLQRRRSIQDERLVEAIRMSAPRRELLVVDARPAKSAMANALNGAGFMILEHYPGCERLYLGIDNIHGVRECYMRVFERLARGHQLRAAKQEAGWIGLCETLMKGTQLIVEHLRGGYSVLVHCSDGWDRTAQLVSLAQICLDPHYRTIAGLIALLQREWISAGHQFDRRLARPAPLNSLGGLGGGSGGAVSAISQSVSRLFLSGSSSSKGDFDDRVGDPQEEFCPIFPQFLDCLRQLMRVYPEAFAFTTLLIGELEREAYAPQTATFVANCDMERLVSDSPSFWQHVVQNPQKYQNPSYRPTGELFITPDVLFYM